jgi:hypothetical protein
MAGLQPETLMAVLEAALGLPHDAGKVSPFIASSAGGTQLKGPQYT